MSQDKLTICPRCGSDACYETKEAHNLVNKVCYGCGFMTHNYMKEDSEFLQEQLEVLPELYKDLTFIDNNGYHWIPSTVNLPNKGMVYINGTNTQDWKWTAVPSVEIPEEDKERFPIKGQPGQYHTHKMDHSLSKDFIERDYMEALDYIGVFENVQK
jgi:hypothetical protein